VEYVWLRLDGLDFWTSDEWDKFADGTQYRGRRRARDPGIDEFRVSGSGERLRLYRYYGRKSHDRCCVPRSSGCKSNMLLRPMPAALVNFIDGQHLPGRQAMRQQQLFHQTSKRLGVGIRSREQRDAQGKR
jgi:hypothetical protein